MTIDDVDERPVSIGIDQPHTEFSFCHKNAHTKQGLLIINRDEQDTEDTAIYI